MDVIDKKAKLEDFWQAELKYADWYLRLEEFLREKIFPPNSDPHAKRLRQSFYETVEIMLNASKIPLAKDGPNFDAERKPIDTIMIHHTSEDPDIQLSRLSSIGLVRQYGLDYLNGNIRGHRVLGKPVWSGHFKDGKMIFFAYHWLVRPNGDCQRLLEDKYIGFQSGNWEINTRSIAICLSGDYSESSPSKEQITSIKKLINNNYSTVVKDRILGHREVNPKTTCPGNKFLSVDGWKKDLLS